MLTEVLLCHSFKYRFHESCNIDEGILSMTLNEIKNEFKALFTYIVPALFTFFVPL